MKKTFYLLSLVLVSLLLVSCTKKLEESELKFITVSDEKISQSSISTNGNNTYIVTFNLTNNHDKDLKIEGSVHILVNDKKVEKTFTEEVKSMKTMIVKVYLSSSIDSSKFSIQLIDINKATYSPF